VKVLKDELFRSGEFDGHFLKGNQFSF
jgi:hypothetical protein